MNKIGIIVLAAGASSRMGSPKQLLKWGETTLLAHVISVAKNTKAAEVFVVLGANEDLIKKSIAVDANILLHNDWEQGLGSSIAFGVKKLQKLGFDGILIMLADQPLVTDVYLNRLLENFIKGDKKIIASRFSGSVGVPAIFSAEYYDELQKLNNDYGAKHLIKSHFEDVCTLQADHLVIDIDTIDAYKEIYKQQFGTSH